jgi:hypothetical protein
MTLIELQKKVKDIEDPIEEREREAIDQMALALDDLDFYNRYNVNKKDTLKNKRKNIGDLLIAFVNYCNANKIVIEDTIEFKDGKLITKDD